MTQAPLSHCNGHIHAIVRSRGRATTRGVMVDAEEDTIHSTRGACNSIQVVAGTEGGLGHLLPARPTYARAPLRSACACSQGTMRGRKCNTPNNRHNG